MKNNELVRSLVRGQSNIDRMKAEISEVVGLVIFLVRGADMKEPLEFEFKEYTWVIRTEEESDDRGTFGHTRIECFEKILSGSRRTRIFSFYHRESLALGQVEYVYDALGDLIEGVIGFLPLGLKRERLDPFLSAARKQF